MGTTITPMGITWPSEWTDPYIDEITITQNNIDAIREDADLMLVGGGDMALIADSLSWSAPIYLYSTRTGNYATIATGSLTVLDGHSIYFNPVSRPMPTAAVSLLSAASIPPAAIMMGVRRGSTVVIRNRGISAISTTLDDAYNNDGGAATIDVDAGDVSWDVAGTNSFIVDLTAVTGDDVDGFIVQNIVAPNGTSSVFRILKDTTNDIIDLFANVGDVYIMGRTGMELAVGITSDITFTARSASKTLSDASNTTFTGLIASETSIYGALNALTGGAVDLTLDDAYNNDGGAATIDVDAGDVSWDVAGTNSFIVDLTAVTGDDVDGFIVQNIVAPNGTSSVFRILKDTTNDIIDLFANVGDVYIMGRTGMELAVGITSDITFTARSASKTLSDASNTTFTGTISGETSIFGALNSLSAGGSTFLGLTDTPSSYTTDGALYVANNSGGSIDESAVILTESTNTFNIAKGTASLDIAAGSTLNVDASCTIDQDLQISASPEFLGITVDSIFGPTSILPVRIGDAGTTSHSLASEDDLLVTGKLEVDGHCFLDNATFVNKSLRIDSSAELYFGSSNESSLEYDLGQTVNTNIFGLSANSRNIIFTDIVNKESN